jgi:SagB-type dehydrogenase family enzyme
MTRHADPSAIRRAPALAVYLRFHEASALAAGVEQRKPPAAVTDAERRALADRGKAYGHGPYERPLEAGATSARMSLDGALLARRSTKAFGPDPLSFEGLSAVLGAYRVTGEVATAGGVVPLRSAPSAGALYPVEVYVAAARVAGLAEGLHHYRPTEAALRLVRPVAGDRLADAVADLLLDPGRCRSAAGAIVLTARFHRTTSKYGERGYRYALLEAGHIAQTLALGAAVAGVALVCHGAFYDRHADRLFGLDGVDEAVIAILLVGAPLAH